MGFIQDLKNEFNASNNNTSDKYSQNELFTIDTENNEKFKLKFAKKGGKLQVLDYIALVIGGPFSQIYYRLTKYKGSLDKPWLLFPLFWIFPFSAVPTYYMSKKKIKKGTAKIKIFDILGFLPMGGIFLSHLISTMYPQFKFVSSIPILISSFIAFYIKDRKKCNNKKFMRIAKRSLFSSLIMISISILFDFLIMGLFKITPFLGPLFNALYTSPLFANIIFSIVAYVSYLCTSMINNTPTILKFCKKRKNKAFIILGITTLILNIIKIVLVPSGEGEDHDEE
jgi:hypothetical protein